MSQRRTFTRNLLSLAIATTSVSLPSMSVHAEGSSAALEQVIVTARRDQENSQDVPVALQVISSETLQGMAMTSPTELAKLVPGLTLTFASNPVDPVIVLRGVRWTQASGTPAIPIYLNEISFDPIQVLQTMYDVDKVEVLRGPQGTTRGAPSISGAVTMETRRPDLYKVGGYVSGLIGNEDHRNLQGAVNMPIVEGKLAVRVAADIEHNNVGGVTSVNSSADPYENLNSGRVSFRLEPTDDLTADLMFQRTYHKAHYFFQLSGTGYPGDAALGIPANYNGPALSTKDYKSAGEIPNRLDYRTDLITLNLSWNVLGHVLSYNFGSQTLDGNQGGIATDPGNLVVGYDYNEDSHLHADSNSFYVNELRLSSDRSADHLIDYDVGAYQQKASGDIAYSSVGAFLGGAFGDPSAAPSPYADPYAINRYTLYANTDIFLKTENYSYYGHMDFHLPEDTEFSVGLRSIHDTKWVNIAPHTTLAYNAFVNPVPASFTCAQLGPLDPRVAGAIDSPTYPGSCDVPVPAADRDVESHKSPHTATIYNASLSHKFTPDLLGYVTTGTSWRSGLPSINNPGLPSDLLVPKPEEATSYELGVKSTLFNDSVRVNAALFQIDYKDQLTQFQYVPYWNSIAGSTSQTGVAFFSNVDSQVRGLELEIAARPLTHLTLSTDFSYAQIEANGGEVPCSGSVSATTPINKCELTSGTSLNASPKLQVSFNGNYDVPMGDLDGYLRWVVDYQGTNTNYGTSVDSAPSYTTVDLFVGVTGSAGKDGGWDVGLYGKNVFDRQVLLTSNPLIEGFGLEDAFGSSGYNRITTTTPREVGLAARYSFGSR